MDLEKLNRIKQNWHDVYPTAEEGINELATELATAWNEFKEKQKKMMELSAAFEEQQFQMDELNVKLSEVDEIVKLSGDEKLSVYLDYLLDKLKDRHDEASKLRLENKISEYTFTNLTFGFELVYLAKEAYALVLKEAGGLLDAVVAPPEAPEEPAKEEPEDKPEVIQELPTDEN